MRSVCRQKSIILCQLEAGWSCTACGKPLCERHRFWSQADPTPGPGGLRAWRLLCGTCFAIEQHWDKPIGNVSWQERRVFLQTRPGAHLASEWDMQHAARRPRRRRGGPRKRRGDKALRAALRLQPQRRHGSQ